MILLTLCVLGIHELQSTLEKQNQAQTQNTQKYTRKHFECIFTRGWVVLNDESNYNLYFVPVNRCMDK